MHIDAELLCKSKNPEVRSKNVGNMVRVVRMPEEGTVVAYTVQ